jgi:hypothetical protein
MPASKAQPAKLAAVSTRPDLYELKGGRTRITYSTTSIAGVPQFHYKDATRDVNFSGNQIEAVQTSLASEVTVTLQLLADLPGIKFTLILPEVSIGTKPEVSFKTFGVTITTAGGLVAPPVGKQRQSYKIVELAGTAEVVKF